MAASRIARPLVLALVGILVAPAAGCLTDAQQYADRIRGEEPLPENYIEVYHDFVAPQHSKAYTFPVLARAIEATADIALVTESSLPSAAPVTPAQIEVSFRGADGSPVGEPVTLDPQNPTANLTLSNVTLPGEYALIVTGNGLSGNDQGAAYDVTIQVFYSRDEA